MGGEVSIGTLKGTITLADQFSGPIEKIGKSLGISSESFRAMTGAAALTAGAIGTAAGAIVALGMHGAEVNDVRDAFTGLSERVGSTGDAMLGALQKGTLGTISNFDLMKMSTAALGTGLVTSAGDMETLAAGAKLLADRTGGDTAQAFDTLTSAMATGRTGSLKALGLFVDTKAAVEDYARSIGKLPKDLTEHEQATARSQAAMAGLRGEIKAAGPDTADFKDNIERAKVAVTNFTDNLGSAIAASPALAAGFASVQKSLESAFGGTQTQTIQTLMGYVNKFAIGLVDAASVGVTAAQYITDAFYGAKYVFNAVLEALFSAEASAAKGLLAISQAAEGIPGIGDKVKPVTAFLQEMADGAGSLALGFGEVKKEAVDSSTTVQVALGGLKQGLEDASAAMGAVADQTGKLGAAAPVAKTGVEGIGAATQVASLSMWDYEAALTAAQVAMLNMAADAVGQMTNMQNQIGLLQTTGVQNRLLELQQAHQAEIDDYTVKYGEQAALLGVMTDASNEKYALQTAAAIDASNAQMASSIGVKENAVQQAEEMLLAAQDHYAQVKASALSTDAQILKSHQLVDLAEGKVDEARKQAKIDNFSAIADAASTILRSIFGKNKAAAIAAAVIDTSAAIVKTLAQLGWWGIPMAAAMAAKGYAEIKNIQGQNPGFAMGTPGTSFVDFGRGTQVTVHDREAIVNQGQGATLGEMLAGMVNDALGRGEDRTVDQLRRMENAARDRDRAMPLWIRDAFLLAPA